MMSIENAWEYHKGDFNSMTDEQIDEVTKEAEEQVEAYEKWLEAVASWKDAGKPRMEKNND